MASPTDQTPIQRVVATATQQSDILPEMPGEEEGEGTQKFSAVLLQILPWGLGGVAVGAVLALATGSRK